ncbi:zinc-dependent alcohol dehydrogenase [Kordiimonas marina]|uniref:zinc-dependent alcohol dehydrogenase n=1 Tax=Kordiimonas marina TaxID=2872312 RepID=UPI001FF64129|nr:alcohol dehydrogenase catalytic domain-containing protein [Kordiimonas marina]MCJ9430325.1 alcohol dehydrogenase catalytic domain-containing protein [Kordiimonas marina]
MTLMKAAKLVAPRRFEIIDAEVPTPTGNDVLIKVRACGICSSEAPVFDGSVIGTAGVSFRYTDFPADLGHEVVGTVEAVGPDVTAFKEGDKVTGLTYSGCGFADYFLEKDTMLVKVPDAYKGDLSLAIGEPLMATMNIIRQTQPDYGDTVLVVGDGYMSLLLIAALARVPLAQLIVVGHHDDRLAMASSFGATAVINGKKTDAWKEIMALTGNVGVQVAVEYAGTASSLQLAASVCQAKVRAKLVLAAAYSNDMPLMIGNYLQNRAPVLIPAYPNQSLDKRHDLERAMWALGEGIFPVEKLITHRFALADVGKGYEQSAARTEGYIKGIVEP